MRSPYLIPDAALNHRAATLRSMARGAQADEGIPAFWRRLGLPGIVDVHVHFLPERVLAKVWAYFDALGEDAWPIVYREDDATRLARLRRWGVRAFPSLSYAHKPGMAEWLNGWSAGFAAATPECLRSATFFPEPGVDRYVAEALEGGARIFKAHLQVGAYDPREPVLRPVWRRLAAARVPVVVHAGSGPEPGPFTGPGPFGEVLAANPELPAIVAHMGMPEYAAFLDLALRYPEVRLDTTMAFTDFVERDPGTAYPRELLEVLAANPGKVLLGTDFPNIPYAYAHQLAALARLGLGEDWLRAVCHDNAVALFGLGQSTSPEGRP
jgi:hypothetical protein